MIRLYTLLSTNNKYVTITVILPIVLLSFFISTAHVYCQPQKNLGADDTSQLPDSLKTVHAKYSAQQRWEKIVDFPGKVLYTPFYLTFLGAEKTAEYIVTPKVVQRIAESLAAYKPKFISFKYSSRHGAGLAYNHRNVFNTGAKFDISGQMGLRNRYRLRTRLTGLKCFSDRLTTDFLVWHRFLSDESFYGIGNDTKKKDESDYGLKQTRVEMRVGTHISDTIFLNSWFGIDVNRITLGWDDDRPNMADQYTETDMPGLGDKTTIARVHIEIRYNTLNTVKRPTSGGVLYLKGGVFRDVMTDKYGIWKISADYRRYIHLFRNRTFIVRVSGERTDTLSGSEIPFYYLTQLGSEETVRGFTRDRFRHRDMMMMSLEYTYHIYRDVLDALVFIDGGQVAGNIFEDFSLSDFHTGYGTGLNVWGSDSITIQALVGISNERTRFHLSWNKHY
ncbi:BamA/TamA family outer membrane protein [Candidatus Latescibacterota bacterium]